MEGTREAQIFNFITETKNFGVRNYVGYDVIKIILSNDAIKTTQHRGGIFVNDFSGRENIRVCGY